MWRCCSCMDHGDLGNAMCTGSQRGHWCRKYGAISFFPSLWHLASKGPLCLIFLCCSRHQALKGPPLLGLLVSYWLLHVGKERLGVAPPSACDSSSIALPPWLPSFPSKAFPLLSPPSCPLSLSPWSQQPDLTLGLLSNPYSPAPSHCAFQGDSNPVQVGKAAAKIAWFSFHSDCHRWAAALSNSVLLPLSQTTALMWVSDPCFRSPHPSTCQSW